MQVTKDIDRNADVEQIQNFYHHLVNTELSAMNELVHRPLKNSTTWQNHRNAKNLKIFNSNLVGDLSLANIFLIPGTVNAQKQTRQYSYTLSYTVQPSHSFTEDWKITLLTQPNGQTVISEIMCTTTGCSRSPFFWPQNYGLK